jgi:hypothetical protein
MTFMSLATCLPFLAAVAFFVIAPALTVQPVRVRRRPAARRR